MNKKQILEGMGEIYCYTCERCGQHSLSRDEVIATKSGKYLCLKCEYKSNLIDIGANGDYLPDLDKIRRLK